MGARAEPIFPSELAAETLTFAAAFEAALFGLVITDPRLPDNPIVRVNAAFCAMTGYRSEEVIDRNCRFLQGPDTDRSEVAEIGRAIAEARPIRRAILNYRKDGAPFWNEIALSPVRAQDGELVGFVGTLTEVTEYVRQQENLARRRLAHLAERDPLTGLGNRGQFETIVGEAIERFDPLLERVVLHSAELGEFEQIRGALGDYSADALLQAVADRLAAFAGPTGRAARVGESQFAILEIRSAAALPETGRRLHEELARSVTLERGEVKFQPHIGIVSYPSDQEPSKANGQELIERAEIARREAKRVGPGAPVLYSREIDDRLTMRVKLRDSLRRAMAQQEFEVHYQPAVDLRDERIVGAEALVRWNHPELGLQCSDHFLPLAEESGLIVPLGEWVLEQAMRQARRWDSNEFGAPRIAVNVSGVQWRHSDFFATTLRLLQATGCNPASIELELTEAFLIDAHPGLIDTLVRIRDLGVDLVIDDFGAGHSSFAYLESLPVDKIKIDRSFIRHMATERTTVVRAIIEMARSLNFDVVCEGIETAQQREFLRWNGCKAGQGGLFSAPLKADDFEKLLLRSRQGLPKSASARGEAKRL